MGRHGLQTRAATGDRLLRQALDVREHEVVAFVGAGGKTTAMFRLARELREAGAGVVVTTTTKMLPPQDGEDALTLAEADRDRLLRTVVAALVDGHLPVAGLGFTPEGKLAGIPGDWVADLAALPAVSQVLVEADGAAHKPLKAPREGEPVIPAATTLLVAVVGADAVGQPLSPRVAHRMELVGELAGLAEGDRLEPRLIARVLLHARGATRGAPPGARVVLLVNKADSPERLVAARALAGELRRQGAGRVIVGAVAGEPPVVEVLDERAARAGGEDRWRRRTSSTGRLPEGWRRGSR